VKFFLLFSLPLLLFASWDSWWKTPPSLSYYKVRSYNNSYTKYDKIFLREGKRWGITPLFLKAIATQETGINEKLRDNGNRNGSVDIGLMRINTIHQEELWSWKRWTLDDMRTNPNKAVYFAAKVLKKCIKIYGLNFNNSEKLANTFSCYNGSQRFYNREKGRVVGDPNLIYGKKILYHILMYKKVGSPMLDSDPVTYDGEDFSIENTNSHIDDSALATLSNLNVDGLNNKEFLKYTFPWKIRME
jgi:hypothetical protein